jgi:hypothetical protein
LTAGTMATCGNSSYSRLAIPRGGYDVTDTAG